jgi:hypothetical protein
MNPIVRIDKLEARLEHLRKFFQNRGLSVEDQRELQVLFDCVEGNQQLPGGLYDIEGWTLRHRQVA